MTSSRSNEELHDLINSIAGELQESQDEPIKSMEPEEAAGYIDHTLLKLDATSAQIDEICEQAKGYKFKVSFSFQFVRMTTYQKITLAACFPLSLLVFMHTVEGRERPGICPQALHGYLFICLSAS